MKYAYPAIFTQTPNGYQVKVPDLPGCITFGDDLPDALDMAKDAVEMWLWDAENQKEAVPPAHTIESVSCASGSFTSLILADTDRYRRENDTRAVKKTLSIPLWLNVKAEKANAPFSQILQEGLKEYLHIDPPQ
ncbi:MAG: type II toxin-antitoxin system HicB family antitoxin [Ethanoligenens sp.]